MTTAFVYSEKFQGYDYGPSHPLKMLRLKLTHELLKVLRDIRRGSRAKN